jgi:hypothetical protein
MPTAFLNGCGGLPLMLSIRGGPFVTVGAAFLFLWMALSGYRPGGWSYSGEPSKPIGARARILWAFCGICLLLYEFWKLRTWAQSVHN